jgi:hypothetical protein
VCLSGPTRQMDSLVPDLDPGIVRAVRVLVEAGIETFESCEGGPGHADRLACRVQITTDGYGAYVSAVEGAFGWAGADFAQLVKTYSTSVSADSSVAARAIAPVSAWEPRRSGLWATPTPITFPLPSSNGRT